jgi:hypothetical protein
VAAYAARRRRAAARHPRLRDAARGQPGEPGRSADVVLRPRHPPEMLPDGLLWARGVQRARHVHVSIMGWARHALADAVAAGVTTSTDLHDWDGEKPLPPRVRAPGPTSSSCPGSPLGGAHRRGAGGHPRDGRARRRRSHGTAERWQPASHTGPARWCPCRPVTDPRTPPSFDSTGPADSYSRRILLDLPSREVRGGGTPPGRVRFGGGGACGTAGTHTGRSIDAPDRWTP